VQLSAEVGDLLTLTASSSTYSKFSARVPALKMCVNLLIALINIPRLATLLRLPDGKFMNIAWKQGSELSFAALPKPLPGRAEMDPVFVFSARPPHILQSHIARAATTPAARALKRTMMFTRR